MEAEKDKVASCDEVDETLSECFVIVAVLERVRDCDRVCEIDFVEVSSMVRVPDALASEEGVFVSLNETVRLCSILEIVSVGDGLVV